MNFSMHGFRPDQDRLFTLLCLGAFAGILLTLLLLMADLVIKGFPMLGWSFLLDYPSRIPERAGVLPALVGSLLLGGLTLLVSFPIGVGAALFLEEYQRPDWVKKIGLARVLELNLVSLSSIPSVVFGLFGLAVFVRSMSLGASLIAGILTLVTLIIPVIVVSTREALQSVPRSVREASYALGASRTQTTWLQVLPAVFPAILSGALVAVGRVLGEAASLIVVGAVAYLSFLPEGFFSPYTVLPVQVFGWLTRPEAGFQENSAGAILVLLFLLLLINAAILLIRNYLGSRKW